jgi:hypothetical protein
MGDGNRVATNAKFQMLARVGHHKKYQLRLFRYLAYIKRILPPQIAYEYMWNCSANLQGGVGKNIPNDNLAEIMVQAVKKKIYSQGANATYASVQKAAHSRGKKESTSSVRDEKSRMQKTGSKESFKYFGMVTELKSADMIDHIPGREFEQFPGFVDRPLPADQSKRTSCLDYAKQRKTIVRSVKLDC